MKKNIIFLLIGVIGITSFPLWAGMVVPAKLQVALFYKIFSYDKNLKSLSKEELLLGVFFIPGNKNSEAYKEEIIHEFQKLSDKTIANKKIVVEEVSSLSAIKGFDIIYVTGGCENQIDEIIAHCHKHKILGISGTEDYANRGLAVSLGIKAGKPLIIINQTSAKECGANFSSQLLSLAKII